MRWKMLDEDSEKFDTDFPGARAFVEAAEKRFQAFNELGVQAAVAEKALDDDACLEGWFQDKAEEAGIAIPQKIKDKRKS